MKRFAFAFGVVACFLSSVRPLSADEVAGAWFRPAQEQKAEPQPPLRTGTAAQVLAALEATSENDILSLRHWNESGRTPARVGITRELEQTLAIAPATQLLSTEPWRWRGSVTLADAHRLRLKLTNLHIPQSATMWVYGESGAAERFDTSLASDGTLWTPSVEGSVITLEIESATGASFDISTVVDIRNADEVIGLGGECVEDAKCYTGLDELSTTVAHMVYMATDGAYICSGGLIIDSAQTFAPYFITANHCISTAAEASSLETFWDFRTSSCGAAPPSKNNLPRVKGSTILSTSAPYDLTLLRLNAVPPGTRYFLGWTSTPVSVGQMLYRLSHPEGQPLRFSTAKVETTSAICSDTPRSRYIYSQPDVGTVLGGSSGSPVLNADGRVVGALSGACPGSADPCGTVVRTTDGSFSAAYETIFKPHLNPGPTACSACTPNSGTACLLGNRFKVTMTWIDSFASLSGNGSIIKYAENVPDVHPTFGPLSEAAFFSMYAHAPKSIETLVRMIKGQNINNKYWVFLTGFAGAEYTVTVQDTKTCQTWVRKVPAGATAMTKDFEAFPFPCGICRAARAATLPPCRAKSSSGSRSRSCCW